MISWLATPTFFFFSFLVLFAWFGYGTVHWNCGGKLVSGYGQLQSGSDILLCEIVQLHYNHSYSLYFFADFVSFFLSVYRRLSFFQVDIFF